MKRLLLFSLGFFLLAIPSRAQSSFDASFGYSYFRLRGGTDINQNGVSGSVAYNPIPFMGAVGDFGYYHGTLGGASLNTYTYLFGPRVNFRNPTKVLPFAQFLFGGAHQTFLGATANNFAYSVGGGVDLGVLPHLAIRPQLDYIGIHNYSPGGTANNTRVSVSAVVHF